MLLWIHRSLYYSTYVAFNKKSQIEVIIHCQKPILYLVLYTNNYSSIYSWLSKMCSDVLEDHFTADEVMFPDSWYP